MAIALTEKGRQRNHTGTHGRHQSHLHSTAMGIQNTLEGGMRQPGTSLATRPPAFQVTVKVHSVSTLVATQSSRGVNIAVLQGFTSPVEEQCSGAVLLLRGAALCLILPTRALSPQPLLQPWLAKNNCFATGLVPSVLSFWI